jgi:monofunctional biosynthetic peptidoglycan transglycosylase
MLFREIGRFPPSKGAPNKNAPMNLWARLRASLTRRDEKSDGGGVTRERPFAARAALALRPAADWVKKRLPELPWHGSHARRTTWPDVPPSVPPSVQPGIQPGTWQSVWRALGPAVRGLAAACAVLLLLPYVLTPLYRIIDPVSTLMLWRWATHARVERVVQPIDLVGPLLPRTVLAAEDGRFCRHHGVDFAELGVVIKADVGGIHRPRGGSSITQQLAKNLFLWPGHSYIRKALEFPLALWIDLILPKRRQLEIYLNIAEWGPNGEFGAEAAARRAFGKPATALSAPEAALLAASLPNPLKRDARRPGDGLRRLAAAYVGRAAGAADIDRCLHAVR